MQLRRVLGACRSARTNYPRTSHPSFPNLMLETPLWVLAVESMRPTRRFSSAPAPRNEDMHRVVVLTARIGFVSKRIGGVILTLDPAGGPQLDRRLLYAVAESLV